MVSKTFKSPTQQIKNRNLWLSSQVGGVEKHQFGLWLAGSLLLPG
jgi:hypothetical protein